MLAWELTGAGFDNLRLAQQPVHPPGPDQLLLRVDAVGICVSDLKVVDLGDKHPRLTGRDMARDPVVLGHECALTVVAAGEKLSDRFRVGDRFVIQADIFRGGKWLTYGYILPGGLAEFNLVGPEVLEGDEGCYLLPVAPSAGYAETALTEPWACVVASYRITPRRAPKAGGRAWIIGDAAPEKVLAGLSSGARPQRIAVTSESEMPRADALPAFLRQHTEGEGFDDILILNAAPRIIEPAALAAARSAVIAFRAQRAAKDTVKLDIGRIHYDGILYAGTETDNILDAYTAGRTSSELLDGGTAWFVGGAGPMGQMHVLRAALLEKGPGVLVATDLLADRTAAVMQRIGPVAEKNRKCLLAFDTATWEKQEARELLRQAKGGEKFDDIVIVAASVEACEDAMPLLGDKGIMNIFAGVARGTMARVDISLLSRKGVRLVGSSGSRIADLQHTLRLTQEGRIVPNQSVAAIGGLEAAKEAIEAVRDRRFAGKIVIYPHIRGLPLTALEELRETLPTAAPLLGPMDTWTNDAEQELIARLVEL
jgi:threonine dehydrogenase-like Zn-dependent dehydrogenase